MKATMETTQWRKTYHSGIKVLLKTWSLEPLGGSGDLRALLKLHLIPFPSHEVPRWIFPGIKRISRQSHTSLFPNFSSAKLECWVYLQSMFCPPTFLHGHCLPGLSPVIHHGLPVYLSFFLGNYNSLLPGFLASTQLPLIQTPSQSTHIAVRVRFRNLN